MPYQFYAPTKCQGEHIITKSSLIYRICAGNLMENRNIRNFIWGLPTNSAFCMEIQTNFGIDNVHSLFYSFVTNPKLQHFDFKWRISVVFAFVLNSITFKMWRKWISFEFCLNRNGEKPQKHRIFGRFIKNGRFAEGIQFASSDEIHFLHIFHIQTFGMCVCVSVRALTISLICIWCENLSKSLFAASIH